MLSLQLVHGAVFLSDDPMEMGSYKTHEVVSPAHPGYKSTTDLNAVPSWKGVEANNVPNNVVPHCLFLRPPQWFTVDGSAAIPFGLACRSNSKGFSGGSIAVKLGDRSKS